MATSTSSSPSATESRPTLIRACELAELRKKGSVVVRGADRPIVLFYNDGEVRAVDNRCPHMGFPLSQGTCENGMITCHWHHARFEARSGCTFDLWADDVEPFHVEVRGSEVYVGDCPKPRDAVTHARRRLREGLEQNLGLIVAKAVLALRDAGVGDVEIVREVVKFGCRYRDQWSMGLTVLSAMANLLPYLEEETSYLALYQGARRVAADCKSQARLGIGFHRLIFPDGSWVSLRFLGLNQLGEGALKDQINRHYFSMFAAVGAVGVLSGLTAAGGNPYQGGTEAMRSGAGQGLGQAATRILDRFLNRLPNITIRAGHRLRVWFTSDVLVLRPTKGD